MIYRTEPHSFFKGVFKSVDARIPGYRFYSQCNTGGRRYPVALVIA